MESGVRWKILLSFPQILGQQSLQLCSCNSASTGLVPDTGVYLAIESICRSVS